MLSDQSWITCPMCGSKFEASTNTKCRTCPVNKGCTLACCPVCGYETVDPNGSILVFFFKKLINLRDQTKSEIENNESI